MRTILANEWRARLGVACSRIPRNTTRLSDEHCKLLAHACFGPHSPLEHGDIDYEDIRRAFIPPVLQVMRRHAPQTSPREELVEVWTVRKNSIRRRSSQTDSFTAKMGIHKHEVIQYLCSVVSSPPTDTGAVDEYKIAVRCMVDISTGRGPPEYATKSEGRRKKYHLIQAGDALQVLTTLPSAELSTMWSTNGVHILPTGSTNGVASFWFVLAIYKLRGSPFAYAHVLPILPCTDDAFASMGEEYVHNTLEPEYRVYFRGSNVLVRLNEHTCRALLLHCCHPTRCTCHGESPTAHCSDTIQHLDVERIRDARWTVLGSRRWAEKLRQMNQHRFGCFQTFSKNLPSSCSKRCNTNKLLLQDRNLYKLIAKQD